jgi:hypothetical protein
MNCEDLMYRGRGKVKGRKGGGRKGEGGRVTEEGRGSEKERVIKRGRGRGRHLERAKNELECKWTMFA